MPKPASTNCPVSIAEFFFRFAGSRLRTIGCRVLVVMLTAVEPEITSSPKVGFSVAHGWLEGKSIPHL